MHWKIDREIEIISTPTIFVRLLCFFPAHCLPVIPLLSFQHLIVYSHFLHPFFTFLLSPHSPLSSTSLYCLLFGFSSLLSNKVSGIWSQTKPLWQHEGQTVANDLHSTQPTSTLPQRYLEWFHLWWKMLFLSQQTSFSF